MIPREDEDFSTKQETASSWSRFKDPRVVRVSKAFGGKDRHSKVCTVRGLRDRRVRLSVPTAIQLYDLQERLGLNQPSKVVDWLLNAAKHEIDDLPPLQIPQATFNPIPPSQSDKQGLKINRHRNDELNIGNQGDYVSSSRQNPTSFTSLLSSTTSPYNSFASNLTLSHPQISLGLTRQHEDLHNYSLVQLQPSAGSHQVLVYQPGLMNTHPYFPSQIAPTNTTFDLKQPNFHTSNSSSDQIIRPFQFTADLLSSQNKQHDELHSS